LFLKLGWFIFKALFAAPPPVNTARFVLPVGIKVRDNESIDRALRRFKRAVNRSRILRIFRANMAYTKPSEEKRLAREKAARSARKRNLL
jgi:small subunit ribosomal protein S21